MCLQIKREKKKIHPAAPKKGGGVTQPWGRYELLVSQVAVLSLCHATAPKNMICKNKYFYLKGKVTEKVQEPRGVQGPRHLGRLLLLL